jgi:hypothetical protein
MLFAALRPRNGEAYEQSAVPMYAVHLFSGNEGPVLTNRGERAS